MIFFYTGRKGFAFIAAIGVLAALFVIVITTSLTSRVLYERTKNVQTRAQLEALADCGAERVKRAFRNQDVTQSTPWYLNLNGNEISARLEPLEADTDIYQRTGIDSREGDLLVILQVTYRTKNEQRYQGERRYVINIKGLRNDIIPISTVKLERKQT